MLNVGASLTAAILIARTTVAVSAPPVPVLPKSLTSRVKFVVAAGALRLSLYKMDPLFNPASKLLICVNVPDNKTEDVPDPVTVTPVVPTATVN